MISRSTSLKYHSFVSLLILIFASMFLITSLSSSQASETTASNISFILDASGSMGASVQGAKKIDVAKKVLTGLIKELPDGVNMGLVFYGHRQKEDCKDVEEIAPLGPPNKQALISRINAITPKGRTPITYSVQKVAEGLKDLKDEATIVLVSDGEETCGGDPCAVVKDLKASGIKFVMHVIGIDVNEKEKKQLECIAKAGGGDYFSAKNANEFSIAAKKAVEKKEPAPPPVATTGKLKLKATRNGKPFQAYYEVLKAGESQEVKVASGSTGTEGQTVELDPGTYDLRVVSEDDAGRPSVDFRSVVIEVGKSVEKVADFSGGALKVKVTRNGKPFSAWSRVYEAAADDEGNHKLVAESGADGEGSATFKLQPGSYNLVVENQDDAGNPKISFNEITVEPSKFVEKAADFSGGALKVKATRNGKPFSAWSRVYEAAADDEGNHKLVAESGADGEGSATFKLQPGSYNLVVENQDDAGNPKISFNEITVEPSKFVEKVADFSGGALKVKATRNGKPFSAWSRVYEAAADDEGNHKLVAESGADGEGSATFNSSRAPTTSWLRIRKHLKRKRIKGLPSKWVKP